jgi:hypothetical protein
VAIHTSKKTVTTTASAMTGTRVTGGLEQSIQVTWISGSDVYLGGPTVETSGTDNIGHIINADNPTFQVKTDEALYARVASSTAVVHVFRTLG